MILNYMGSKTRLMPVLYKVIDPLLKKAKSQNKHKNIVFGDMFAGTGYVGNYFKNHSCIEKVITTDLELYSYVLSKALLETVYSNKLALIIKYFNSNKLKPIKGLIWKHFSPAGGRMFYTEENAKRIDAIRICISKLYHSGTINYKEFLFLLASLMCACSKSANTASCFRAYLKQFHPRSEKSLEMYPIHKSKTRVAKQHVVYKSDCVHVAKRHQIDVAYLDPPYNANHYGGYYSLYNYLLVYNSSYEINGVAGVTKHYNKSMFGFKASAKASFSKLLDALNSAKYVIMSYSADGTLSKKEVCDILRSKGNVIVYKTMNKKYRPSVRVKDLSVVEYIIVLEVSKTAYGNVTEKWIR